jgi:hypothetical protein
MSVLTALARIRAAHEGRAVPLSRLRHLHLNDHPLVVMPLNHPGSSFQPLAVMAGTSRHDPHLITAPRGSQWQNAALLELADLVLAYIEQHQRAVEYLPATANLPERQRFAQAPQILVPNSQCVTYLEKLARRLRMRPPGQDPADPDNQIIALGRWLEQLTRQAAIPGSAAVLPLPSLLTQHWATGQSRLEDAILASVMAWIDPPPNTPAHQAARATDHPTNNPPAGPTTDPAFDTHELQYLLRDHDRAARQHDDTARAHCAAKLANRLAEYMDPTWQQMWDGLSRLQALPPSQGAARRWAKDRSAFTAFTEGMEQGRPPRPARDGIVTAARDLAVMEKEQAALEAERALEDPFVLAELRSRGDAFTGTVIAVDATHTEPGRGKNVKYRPRFTVITTDPLRLPPGRKLATPDLGKSVFAKILDITVHRDTYTVDMEIVGGMGRVNKPNLQAIPTLESEVSFTTAPDYFPLPAFPTYDQIPWTHGGPAGPPPTGQEP